MRSESSSDWCDSAPAAPRSSRGRLAALAHRFEGRDDQPSSAPHANRNAYLTDLLQEFDRQRLQVDPILIEGQWREIDTGQDLDRARMLLESRSKEWT